MSIIYGKFTFNGVTFDAEYRDAKGGSNWSQRGFDKCLIIGRGSDGSDGHGYFGDDKWKVEYVVIGTKEVIITLDLPLRVIGDIWNSTQTVTLIRK
jgi:hypothetical protein